ncbi:hypothetical protein HMPREF1544_12323 [Mucor circinelloides 1006PhL]|uniref:Uncharacterized protein n=1 Tax=Mucor circinelloides f. circinelloides (strain 1006PhL) TaxID=1220926 RepID=S2JEQ4_MUCC1|nr:hypothetical protein HMPREF1544_12323 [Mucor circinelloides 1006PhL]
MQGGETTTEQYLNRFSRSSVEAEYDSNDTAIADAFLNGFSTDWQIQITALLCNTFPGQDSWTTNQVARAAMNILGNLKHRHMSFVGRAAEANPAGYSKDASGGGKFGGQQQGHRAKRENAQSSEITFSCDKEGGKRNVPTSATRPTFCLYCGKRWIKGRSCPEYHAAMKANGGQKPTMHVLSIKKSKTKTSKKKRHHCGIYSYL